MSLLDEQAPLEEHGWTHPICDACWIRREGDRRAFRIVIPDACEWCCFCLARIDPLEPGGGVIYVRADPAGLACDRRTLEG